MNDEREKPLESPHLLLTERIHSISIGVRSSAASSHPHLSPECPEMMESGAGFAAMEERILPGSFFQFPLPGFSASLNRSPCPSPPHPPTGQIRRISSLSDLDRYEHGSPFRSPGLPPTNGKLDFDGWSMMQAEASHIGQWKFRYQTRLLLKYECVVLIMVSWFLQESFHHQRASPFRAPAQVGWVGMPGLRSPPIVKKVIRLDVPVDKFPTYNFVGRILGPRGNSLKRVDHATQCRVFIRGRGSVKDTYC
ncbi:unnamed protein product [Brassica oleracea]|nr:unnamed protein product [Brassica napus]